MKQTKQLTTSSWDVWMSFVATVAQCTGWRYFQAFILTLLLFLFVSYKSVLLSFLNLPIFVSQYFWHSLFFSFTHQERLKTSSKAKPAFNDCCARGRIALPTILPPPESICQLYSGSTPISKRFLNNIRVFNNAFAFTSLGTDSHGKGTLPIPGKGPRPFQAKSNLYHRLGSLVPGEGHVPLFSQIYFHHANQDSSVSINQRLDFIHNQHPLHLSKNINNSRSSSKNSNKGK